MKKRITVIIVVAVLLIGAAAAAARFFGLIPEKTYSGARFGIETAVSAVDFDGDGVDDYADILLGAKLDAENCPVYKSAYYNGGYPPETEGVCTDVVWRAFRSAGYSLRDMVDADAEENPDDYPDIETRDSNIDFRRVRNLHVFFSKYAVELTTDIEKIAEWQPGDIVIFGDDTHIGIVSDKRDRSGHAYVIHNAGQPNRDENRLIRGGVTAHFRFDAEKIDGDVLKPWGGE